MTGTLIATTKNAAVHALAYKGIPAWDRFPQLCDTMARQFGDKFDQYFARPVENRAASEMDWYSQAEGEVRRMADLPAAEKEAVCVKIRQMATEVNAYAEELCASPDPLKVTRGHLLKLALLFPDESYIHTVGDQPVIVCWGFGPGTPGVEPKSLVRLATPPQPAPPVQESAQAVPVAENTAVPPPAAPAKAAVVVGPSFLIWSWLWWLLPLAALLFLLWLLFTSFGGMPPIAGWKLFNGPELPFRNDAPDRSSEIRALENEIAALHNRVMQHAALCKKEEAPVIAAPPHREDLVIPDKAEDASFLAGEWLCRTGLANARTREPVEFAFEFNTDGQGRATVYEKDDRCMGDARANFDAGELRIIVSPLHCARSDAAYSGMSIICSGAGGATRCEGANKGGGSWDANFEKIR